MNSKGRRKTITNTDGSPGLSCNRIEQESGLAPAEFCSNCKPTGSINNNNCADVVCGAMLVEFHLISTRSHQTIF